MKPLVGAAVLLTGVASLSSALLPTLARQAEGLPFLEVQPDEVEPEGAPSGLAMTAPAPTVPPGPFDGDDEAPADDEAADPEDPVEEEEGAEEEEEAVEEPPANDLTDIPPYPVPAGFEVLETWNDGDFVRVSIYAATNGDEAALLVYLGADRDGWVGVDIDELNGVDSTRQWLYEREDHPYCIWIEYYDKGLEREDLEVESGLVGPQFMVVETNVCEGLASPYA